MKALRETLPRQFPGVTFFFQPVHYQSVQLGRDRGQSVEVLSGLTGRERLVVNPPDGLKEGARVAGEERTDAM